MRFRSIVRTQQLGNEGRYDKDDWGGWLAKTRKRRKR